MGKGKGKGKGNKAKGAFWHFMVYKQGVLKESGQNYALTDPKLLTAANDEWKVMTKSQKTRYESMAKAEKERLANANRTIDIAPQSYGQRVSDYNAMMARASDQLDEPQQRALYIDKLIESCVKACKTKEDLLNASFFIMGSNVMFRTDDKPPKYPPLEIGICQYTIQSGIMRTVHEFIDPGDVPLGYYGLYKEHMELTHKITVKHFSSASNNYDMIVKKMFQLLENSRFFNKVTGEPTPMLVFCREDAIDQNKGIFEWLAAEYRKYVPNFYWNIEVLDLSALVFQILDSTGDRKPLAFIEDKLQSAAFDWSANTRCKFHEDSDGRYCAQGLARQLCYMLSQMFAQIYNIAMTDRHLPPGREGVVAETSGQAERTQARGDQSVNQQMSHTRRRLCAEREHTDGSVHSFAAQSPDSRVSAAEDLTSGPIET